MKKVALITAVCAFLFSSCAFVSTGKDVKVVPVKNTTTVQNTISDISKISIALSCDVEYVITDGEPYVKIQAPENFQEYIIAEVKNSGRTLEIHSKAGYQLQGADIEITVASKSLCEVTIAGSADFSTDAQIEAENFVCTIAGSGEMEFDSLKASKVKATIAGSGDMELEGLDCAFLDISIAGSGDIKLAGKSQSAKVSIAGSGDIDAKELLCDDFKSSVAGSGSIKR